MNFEIVWQPSVYPSLEAILQQNPGKEENLIELIRTMDRRLSEDPYADSESREMDRRIFILLPLIATIRVFFRRRQVLITDVRLHGSL